MSRGSLPWAAPPHNWPQCSSRFDRRAIDLAAVSHYWQFAATFALYYTLNRFFAFVAHWEVEGGLLELWRGCQCERPAWWNLAGRDQGHTCWARLASPLAPWPTLHPTL